MASVIERASSGRAKCRACGQAISKGELRFGEALPNAYGEGETLFWFHLRCAACCRPESFLPTLEQGSAATTSNEAEDLRGLAEEGVAQPRLSRIVRAERASSGRARCRYCFALIEQGTLRIALQLFEEGRFNAIGTIHAACAVHYFGAEPGTARFGLPGSELGFDEQAALVAEMQAGALRSIQPGLAKTSGDEPNLETTRKSS